VAHPHAGGFADGRSAGVADKEPVALAHLLDRLRMALRDPAPLSMFIHDEQVVLVITAREEHDGVVSETVIHARDPLGGAVRIEFLDDMDVVAKRVEERAGSDVPIAFQPGLALPAGGLAEDALVFGIEELVVVHAGRDEARGGLSAALVGHDEQAVIPIVADAPGIGGGVEAGAPAGLGGAQTGADVLVFALGQGGGFF
jgi:hypothetical protein